MKLSGGGPADETVAIGRAGDGPPVLFVHGSIMGAETWRAQRPLGERWTVLVLERRGFGRSPPTHGDDYEVDARDMAAALGDGAHLVARSHGAVGAMLAALARPEAVHSLTLVEPVAYSVALGHPDVHRAVVQLIDLYTTGPTDASPFLNGFLRMIGTRLTLPDPLAARLENATRPLMNARPPFPAVFRPDELAQASFRTLVVSGGHSPAFEAICDRLVELFGAERSVIRGANHAVPAKGAEFNETLERFRLTS